MPCKTHGFHCLRYTVELCPTSAMIRKCQFYAIHSSEIGAAFNIANIDTTMVDSLVLNCSTTQYGGSFQIGGAGCECYRNCLTNCYALIDAMSARLRDVGNTDKHAQASLISVARCAPQKNLGTSEIISGYLSDIDWNDMNMTHNCANWATIARFHQDQGTVSRVTCANSGSLTATGICIGDSTTNIDTQACKLNLINNEASTLIIIGRSQTGTAAIKEMVTIGNTFTDFVLQSDNTLLQNCLFTEISSGGDMIQQGCTFGSIDAQTHDHLFIDYNICVLKFPTKAFSSIHRRINRLHFLNHFLIVA